MFSGEFQGNQAGTTFDPGTMTDGIIYYWRIDEISAGGTATGTVWSFTASDLPRVIVSTDISATGDPDDFQSMVHYLVYGLCCNRTAAAIAVWSADSGIKQSKIILKTGNIFTVL